MKLIKASGGTCYGYVCDVRNREDIYKKGEIEKKLVGEMTCKTSLDALRNILSM